MPAFDVVGNAQRWFDRAWTNGAADETKLAAMRAQLEADDAAMMSGAKTGNIINGNMNGASFTIANEVPLSLRVAALQMAINGLENGIRPGRYARAYYPQ